MIEFITLVLVTLILTVASSLMVGYSIGRFVTLRQLKDSNEYTREFIHGLIEETAPNKITPHIEREDTKE